jgi:predicted NACHT family NTPase
MAEINQIKASFQNQVRAEFENPKISPFTQNWQPGIDLLFELIKFPIDGINLYNDLLNALEDVLINKPTDYNALVSFVNYLEKYLALVGNFTGQTAAMSKPFTLMPLIKAVLSIKPPTFDCKNRANIDTYRDDPKFLAHIYRAYCTRNDVNHSGDEDGGLPNWAENQSIILQNRDSVLVVFLYATILHQAELQKFLQDKQLSEQPNIIPYLNQVAEHFKKWQKRFVAIHSTEKIELYAREELDEIDQKPRQDTVENLHQQIPMLMVLGEAGMGKTTTLQYLVLKTANKCRSNTTQANLPVYLELKLFTGDRTLLSEILQKLPFSLEFNSQLLEDGKISLFLDGLNEVSKPLKQDVINQIQSLIKRYPNIRMLISSRSSYQFMIDDKRVPVFALQKMTQTQIEAFLKRNTQAPTRKIIQTSMASNQRLLDWLRVPMMLKMMIEVVEDRQMLPEYQDEPIPENKHELIDNFIGKIYRRERDRDANFHDSEITFDTLITHLAVNIFESAETNTALKKIKVISILTEKVKSGFPNADLEYFLRASTELGILALDGDVYSFVHEEYLDYYVAKWMEFDF